jgi:hypothetical protein
MDLQGVGCRGMDLIELSQDRNSTRHLSLFSARSIQSVPTIPLPEDVLILNFHLCLGLPSGPFPQVSSPNPGMHLISPPYVPHVPLPNLSLLDFITWIFGEESALCSLLHSSPFSLFLRIKLVLPNTLSLCYSHNARTQFHSHKKKHSTLQFCIS